MKKALLTVLAVTLVMTVTSIDSWAQATAQITGTVKDQTGAVLPGVEVTATQTETGIARTAITNETGSYVLPNLAIGPYRLEASLPGFRTYAQTGIVLQVNANPVINATLEVGQVSEQVEVEANATQVETRSVGVGQVVENARILDLPLNGRQVVDLIGLAGGRWHRAGARQQRQQQRLFCLGRVFGGGRFERRNHVHVGRRSSSESSGQQLRGHAVSGCAPGIQA
jgi:hypothetical protein